MANLPYTQQTIQDRIHTLYENDPNTPATTDDEWTIRNRLINQAIATWESQDVYWNELWAVYTHATPAAYTTLTYAVAATDIRFPGSFVKFTKNNATSYIEVVAPEDMTKYKDNAMRCFFTGDVGSGFTLNLGWTPASGDLIDGATISFGYYKSANTLTATTDKPQMSDPNYIIYWVAAQKHLMDSNTNLFSTYDTLARDSMQNMRIRNEQLPANGDQRLDDIELIKDYSYFGG